MSDTTAVFRVLNEMQAAKIIDKYAIGGAVAAAFYIEPTSTLDIDVFIPFENMPGSPIASLGKLYEYLTPHYRTSGAHFLMSGWQVQFLPADDDLNKEALLRASERQVGDVNTWVMRPEHLMAIALRTGRGKDFIRLEQFVRHAACDKKELHDILSRHNLLEKWRQFNDKYITAQND